MLPTKQRLKKNSAFSATYRQKKSVATSLFFLHVGKPKTDNNPTKVGFVISKKVHKRAVKRNRAKRLMREAYKKALKEGQIAPPWISMIFTAKEPIIGVKFDEIYQNIIKTVKKAQNKYEKTIEIPLSTKQNALQKISIKMIKIYQFLSKFTPKTCRFYPSCSEYTKQAIIKYGFFKGCILGAKRIVKCHPFNSGGIDELK